MRIETNEDLVSRNRKIATYMFIFSLIVLVLGFLAANGDAFGITFLSANLYLAVMPILLIVGLAATLISVRMTNYWIRMPRPEDAIREGLKGLSNKSVLYNYLHLPARHVLICPQGIFVIATRFQDGRIAVDEDKWQTRRSPLSAVFSMFRMDGIGDPTSDATKAAEHIQDYVDEINADIKVQPLILFVDPRAKIEVGETTIPVLHADPKSHISLKDYLRKIPKEERTPLTDEEIQAFEEATIEYEETE